MPNLWPAYPFGSPMWEDVHIVSAAPLNGLSATPGLVLPAEVKLSDGRKLSTYVYVVTDRDRMEAETLFPDLEQIERVDWAEVRRRLLGDTYQKMSPDRLRTLDVREVLGKLSSEITSPDVSVDLQLGEGPVTSQYRLFPWADPGTDDAQCDAEIFQPDGPLPAGSAYHAALQLGTGYEHYLDPLCRLTGNTRSGYIDWSKIRAEATRRGFEADWPRLCVPALLERIDEIPWKRSELNSRLAAIGGTTEAVGHAMIDKPGQKGRALADATGTSHEHFRRVFRSYLRPLGFANQGPAGGYVPPRIF